jgi:hypothetical protein
MDEAAERRRRRQGWKVHVSRSFAEADDYDVDFWLGVPVDERAAMTWQLSWELHQIAHPGVSHEPRLRRSATRLTRR